MAAREIGGSTCDLRDRTRRGGGFPRFPVKFDASRRQTVLECWVQSAVSPDLVGQLEGQRRGHRAGQSPELRQRRQPLVRSAGHERHGREPEPRWHRGMRAALPSPYWISIAAWSVGAYGEGAWANARRRAPSPASRWRCSSRLRRRSISSTSCRTTPAHLRSRRGAPRLPALLHGPRRHGHRGPARGLGRPPRDGRRD